MPCSWKFSCVKEKHFIDLCKLRRGTLQRGEDLHPRNYKGGCSEAREGHALSLFFGIPRAEVYHPVVLNPIVSHP